jgi:hypothetical protein
MVACTLKGSAIAAEPKAIDATKMHALAMAEAGESLYFTEFLFD